MIQLAKLNFVAEMVQLPTDWRGPPVADQYPQAFQPGELVVAPNSPMNLFREPTLNKYHVDTAKDVGQRFEKYIEGICKAICQGIGNWMKAATVVKVIINGPVGLVTPGSVLGPPLMPLILAHAPMVRPMEIRYSLAIAQAFNIVWLPWHMSISGMLTYPAFAAVTSPVAPPMPNVPMPLVALPSAAEASIAPVPLANLMMMFLGDPTAMHARPLFNSIAKAFFSVFQIFKASTLVQNVLGTGPVPTFAPPVVPVGPVVMGIGTGPPGCIR